MAIGDANDECFVARMASDWGGYNVDDDVADWLQDDSRRW